MAVVNVLNNLLCSVIGKTSMHVLLRRRVTLFGVLQLQNTTHMLHSHRISRSGREGTAEMLVKLPQTLTKRHEIDRTTQHGASSSVLAGKHN